MFTCKYKYSVHAIYLSACYRMQRACILVDAIYRLIHVPSCNISSSDVCLLWIFSKQLEMLVEKARLESNGSLPNILDTGVPI